MTSAESGADAAALEIRAVEGGCTLAVRVRAGGRRNQVGGVQENALRVEVTTAPEKGKANQAVRKLLAKSLGLAPGRLELVSGETCPAKVFRIAEVTPEELRNKLQLLCEGL